MNETLHTILNRRSIRSYQPQQISEPELQEILLAGQYAPTGMGQQPWHFTVLQNHELIEKLQILCKATFLHSEKESLRTVALQGGFHIFYHAPTLIIVSGNTKAVSPVEDCTLAMGNMLLAATSLGIGSCWVHSVMMLQSTPEGVASFNALNLGIPEGYAPYAAAVFGYSAVASPKAKARKPDTITYIR